MSLNLHSTFHQVSLSPTLVAASLGLQYSLTPEPPTIPGPVEPTLDHFVDPPGSPHVRHKQQQTWTYAGALLRHSRTMQLVVRTSEQLASSTNDTPEGWMWLAPEPH